MKKMKKKVEEDEGVAVYIPKEETIILPEEVWKQIDEECEKTPPKRSVCVALDMDVYEKLKRLALKHRKSVSDFLKEKIVEMVKNGA
jgi:hypothetical protein